MGVTVNLSEYSRDVLKGLKEEKGHKNYDSALREIFFMADIDTDELVEVARKDEENNLADNFDF